MVSFRIAHVSDLHFGKIIDWQNPLEDTTTVTGMAREAVKYILNCDSTGRIADVFYPSTFSPDAAAALSHILSSEMDYLDAILVSGDLATTGDDSDLTLAKNYFHGEIPSDWNPSDVPLRSWLDNEEIAVVTLPGNHDRFANLSQPLSKNFEEFFGKYWDFDRGKSFGVAHPLNESGRVRLTTLLLEDVILAIFAVDLSLEHSHSGTGLGGYVGQGRVLNMVLNELAAAAICAQAEAKEQGFSLVLTWAVHFPPSFPGITEPLMLHDSQKLVDAACACGVAAIFSGHTHETLLYTAKSTSGQLVKVICSGPSAGVSKHGRYSFSIVDIEVTKSSVKVIPKHFLWSDYKFQQQSVFPS